MFCESLSTRLSLSRLLILFLSRPRVQLLKRILYKTGKCWWKASEDGSIYAGLEESIDFIKSCIPPSEPIGILGFSQGSCFAAILCSKLPNIKMAILIGGFKPRAQGLDLPMLCIPSLHIYGLSDEWVVPERSKQLMEYFDPQTRTVYEHSGG